MAKTDIWMPFYVADYLSDTMHLSAAEHGGYLMLILHYWKSGPIPDDDARLAIISRMGDAWSNASSTIRAFFEQRDGMLVHHRIERERAEASSNKNKKQAKAKAAAEARWGKNASGNAPSNTHALHTACPSPSPSPSPNGDKNIGAGALDVVLETDPAKLEAIEHELAKHNGEPPARVPKRAPAPPIELPDWMPRQAWDGFVAMRKKIRKPLADSAIPLAVKKLEDLRAAGHDPEAVLEQSTLNSWQGLFELRSDGRGGPRSNGRPSMNNFPVPDGEIDPFDTFRRA